MTVENCIKWLKIFKRRIELQGTEFSESQPDGRGRDSDERASITKTATKAYANMKQHILTSKKFKDHPILEELKDKSKEKEELEEKPKEKEDGKKPKR